jgi:hypothetical protein
MDIIIDELLNQFQEHRDAIKVMIDDLEKLKIRIDTLIPASLDARYIRFFEEKIKAVTALFNVLLDMRKEIASTLKNEIEIRRKLGIESDLDIEGLVDIRKLSRKVEEFQEQKENLRLERVELQKEDMKPEVEIVSKRENLNG